MNTRCTVAVVEPVGDVIRTSRHSPALRGSARRRRLSQTCPSISNQFHIGAPDDILRGPERGSPITIDRRAPPFDQYTSISRLAPARSGHESHAHVRHQLYVARGRKNPVDVLIKLTSKPVSVYEQDLNNEISTLSTISCELPDSKSLPVPRATMAGSTTDASLIMSLFDELPLATIVGAERMPHRLVGHLMTAHRGRTRAVGESIASRSSTSI